MNQLQAWTIILTFFVVAPLATAKVRCVQVDSRGGVLIASDTHPGHLVRQTKSGTLDRTFSQSWTGSGFNGPIYNIAIQQDGKILVGGEFTEFNNQPLHNLARLNPDGSLDQGFAENVGQNLNEKVQVIIFLSDGSIVIGGAFTQWGDQAVPFHAKLDIAGKLDSDFTLQSEANAPVLTAHFDQQNQVIYLGGGFRDQAGQSVPLIQLSETGAQVSNLKLKTQN